jgi:hypothetical protein
MEKKRNLWVIPTDKPTYLYEMEGKFHLSDKFEKGNEFWHNQNIYITSDEEIKEGDYFIGFAVTNKKPYISCASEYKERKEEKGKIILTTDQDLIKDGVQAIDDDFLEWFVKNSSCERVEVEKGCVLYDFKYKIIIPKEEPKQETLEEAGLKHCDILDKFPALINPLFSFKEGAKWQQEQNKNLYSEEDLEEAFTQGFNARYKMQDGIESREKFMRQFKKK